jgi:hypothetical protein
MNDEDENDYYRRKEKRNAPLRAIIPYLVLRWYS